MNGWTRADGFALDLDLVIRSSQLIWCCGDIVRTVQLLAIFEFPIKRFLLLVFPCGTFSPDWPLPLCGDTAIFSFHNFIRKREGYCRSTEYGLLFTSTCNLSSVYPMNFWGSTMNKLRAQCSVFCSFIRKFGF